MSDLRVDIGFQRGAFRLSAAFQASQGKVTVVLGVSGSGKSTLLRLLAGLERPHRGFVHNGSQTWFDSKAKINKPPQQRAAGFVFQDYALFENMTAVENIGFGVPRSERSQRSQVLLEKLDLLAVKDRYPGQLSGGQRQRVALGRALAIQPSLLLLDEPLSAVDHSLRKQLQLELKRYINLADCPVILVTHDLEEAHLLADQLIVMHKGTICRQGPATVVFQRPLNRVAAITLGWQNIIPLESWENGMAKTRWGAFHVKQTEILHPKWLAIKPEKIRFVRAGENTLHVYVEDSYDLGMYREYHCKVDDTLRLIVKRPIDEPAPSVGDKVPIHFSARHLQLLAEVTDAPAGVAIAENAHCATVSK